LLFGPPTRDNLLDLIDAVDPRDAEGRMFYMHPLILNLIRRAKNLQDAYLLELPAAGVPFQPGKITTRLWGHQVVTVNDMTAASASGAGVKLIAFGDPQNVVVGTRQEIEVASSPRVLFTTDQTAVRATACIGVALPRPGAFSVLKTAAW
jgi:HK97 family phage major capsid protein